MKKVLNLNMHLSVYVIVRSFDNLFYDFIYITQSYQDCANKLEEYRKANKCYKTLEIARFQDCFKLIKNL